LYDPDENKLYSGDFINNNPKEGKNLKIFELNGDLKYEGDFLNGMYHKYGKLYGNGEYENKGIFSKYKRKIYEGEFEKGNYKGIGKLYKDNELGKYLFYEGNFNNNMFDGKGILFCPSGEKFYEGNFNKNKIEGKGIKYYKKGSKKYEGIFDTINSFEGIYYSPDNKEIYNGKIVNEIPLNCKNCIIYNDNTFKIYEGGMKNGKYEGYGIEYCPLDKKK